MTLRLKIENTDPNAFYEAVVRTHYTSKDLNGNTIDYGHNPPHVVKPGESHDVWISSNMSVRIDEQPVLGTPKE